MASLMLNCGINTRIFSPNIVAAEAIWFHASGKYFPFLKESIVAEGLENNKSAANYCLWAAWAADDADPWDRVAINPAQQATAEYRCGTL
jgi:hypothetical protein